MKIYMQQGIDGCEEPVYRLKTLSDWDEYENILKEMDPDFAKKWEPNFYSFKTAGGEMQELQVIKDL